MKKEVVIPWVIIGILIIGGGIYLYLQFFQNEDNGVVCKQDAKLCQDGSYVGRNPNNNCEFYDCPVSENVSDFLSDISSGSCTLDLNPNLILSGGSVVGTIHGEANTSCLVFASNGSEWRLVYLGVTGANGNLISTQQINLTGTFIFRAICDLNHNNIPDIQDCVTNQETLVVNTLENNQSQNDTDSGYDVGDVVGGSSGSGTITGKEDLSITFNLSHIQVGGDCYLGARIYTKWNYDNQSSGECYTVGGMQQGVDWVFVDSEGIKWAYSDAIPQTHNVDLCPLNWDGQNPWKLFITPYYDIPGCKLNYEYNVQIYVCECN